MRTALAASAAALLAPAAEADLYSSTVPPLPIKFGQTVTKLVTVGDSLAISDLNVIVQINHLAVGELGLTLRHPDGTSVTLAHTEGGAQAGFVLTTFDDEATGTLATGTAPFKGTFRPTTPLSVFDGKSAAGTWTLDVRDVVPSTDGTLFGFALAFNGATFVYGGPTAWMVPCGPAEFGIDVAPSSPFTIRDVDLAVDLSHNDVSDLKGLTLVGPAGIAKPFANMFPFFLEKHMHLACFDDEAPVPVSGPAPFTGRWQTKFGSDLGVAFSAFDGLDAQAQWLLRVYDQYCLSEQGLFQGWLLHFTSSDTCLGVPATATAYGAGTAGTLGVPSLGTSAPPEIGTSFTIDVGNSLGSATPGGLLVGASATSIPLLGGTLLVAAPALLPFAVSAAGASLPVTLAPSVATCGQRVYLQAAQLDPGAPAGVAFSAGLELVIGS